MSRLTDEEAFAVVRGLDSPAPDMLLVEVERIVTAREAALVEKIAAAIEGGDRELAGRHDAARIARSFKGGDS